MNFLMSLQVPSDSIWLLIFVLVLAGLASGFLSGLLGIGGGGVLVPVLYEAFGLAGVDENVRMHVTLGTTLAIIAPTVLRSLAAHHVRGNVDFAIIKRMGPWVFAGVVVGVIVADQASSVALRWVWVVFGTLLALKMAFGRDDWKISDQLPKPPRIEIAAFLIGLISTMMGIGGATFTVPLLTLYGRSILNSVGTATGIGAIIALPGLVGYMIAGLDVAGLPPYSIGYVSLMAGLIIPISVVAAPMGVRVAHGISKRALEIAFAIFISVVVVRFLSTLL